MYTTMSKLVIILIIIFGVGSIAVIIGLTIGIPLIICASVEAPTNLIIRSPSARFIQLSWVNSEENGDCSVSYIVSYKINNDEPVERTTTNPYLGLTSLDLCYTFSVYVWAISITGRYSNKPAIGYYNSNPIDPDDIPLPIDGKFSQSNQSLLLTWWKARELDSCDVYYKVRLVIDNTFKSNWTTFHEAVAIPEDDYCLSVDVYITTVIRGSVSSEFLHSYTYFLRPPEDIIMSISHENHSVISSWSSHPKQHLCGMLYRVKYSLQNSEEKIYTISDNRITLEVAYCNTATVEFSTVAGEMESRGSKWLLEEKFSPAIIDPVHNIRIVLTSKTIVQIFWDLPTYVNSCKYIDYIVIARNMNSYKTNMCIGKLSCTINVEDLCPMTNFTILTSWIPGEAAVRTYECPTAN